MTRTLIGLHVLALAALLLTACADSTASAQLPPEPPPTERAQESERVAQASTTTTIQPTAAPSRTPRPTFTPIPTATNTPTAIPTATETPTVTPTATLPPPSPTATVVWEGPTPTPTPNEQGEIVHLVQPGESVYTIAAQYGVLWSQITAYNQIGPNDVEPGVTVRIPVGMMGQRYTGNGQVVATPLPSAVTQDRVILSGMTHDWQKLNNCGPTSTSVLLSYYGINHSQLTIASVLKPVGGGDKNVSPAEIASYANIVGLGAFVGINGSIELAEQLISAGFPFIAEQWMDYDGGVGHYRVVRGFDRTRREILFNDTFLGPDIWRSYDQFLRDWAAYNNTYIVFYRPEEEAKLQAIIGPDWNPSAMWERLRAESQARLDSGDQGAYVWYGLAEALHQLGRDREAVSAYEQAIAIGLPWRYLWYRYGYFEALNAIGQYEKTLQVTAPVLEAMQMSEDLRYHRAVALRELGRTGQARAEFEAALRDNPNFAPAKAALAALGPAPAPTAPEQPAEAPPAAAEEQPGEETPPTAAPEQPAEEVPPENAPPVVTPTS